MRLLRLLLVHISLLLLSRVLIVQTAPQGLKQDTKSSLGSIKSNEWIEKIAIDHFSSTTAISPKKKTLRTGAQEPQEALYHNHHQYYYRIHNTTRRDHNENLRPQRTRTRTTASGGPEVDHRTLIAIIANFRGYTKVTCDAKDVNRTIFDADSPDSVASFYREHTHGKINFASSYEPTKFPNVVGPYTITIDAAAGCAPLDWAEKIEATAYSNGINLNGYQHKMFIIPKIDVKYYNLI